MNNPAAWSMLAGIMMALSVAMGAFGAHGLKAVVSPELLTTWQTAVQYHLIHALALLGLALFARVQMPNLNLKRVFWGILLGILLFSGSLYLWVLTQWHPLVFFTPIGGSIWVLSWLMFAWTQWRQG